MVKPGLAYLCGGGGVCTGKVVAGQGKGAGGGGEVKVT